MREGTDFLSDFTMFFGLKVKSVYHLLFCLYVLLFAVINGHCQLNGLKKQDTINFVVSVF